MLRTRTVAELALARNRWFTPHTWTNGHRPARESARGGRRRRRAVHRVPVRPAGLDTRAPRRLPGRAHPSRPRRRPARAVGAGPRAPSSTRPPSRGTRHDGRPGTGPRPPDRRGLARPGRGGRPAQRGVHRWPVRSGRVGRDVPRHRRTRRLGDHARSPQGDVEDVERAVARGANVLRRPPLGGPIAGEPQARPAEARRPHPRATARSWPCSSRSTSASRSATRSRSTCPRRRRPSSGTRRRSTRSTARSARPGRTPCRS